MPMGIVSDDEFDSEIKNSSHLPDIEIKELPNKGRKEGDNNVPNGLRNIIGETAITEGRTESVELAKQFGISPSSASSYANGSTSTKSYDRKPNLDYLNKVRERISRKARNRLIKSLDHITDDKLQDAKAEVLASVARNMSAIVKEMEPEISKDNDGKSSPTFVIFSPTFKKEEHFEHIFVQDGK